MKLWAEFILFRLIFSAAVITAATSNGGALKVILSDCLQSRELLQANSVFYLVLPAFNNN